MIQTNVSSNWKLNSTENSNLGYTTTVNHTVLSQGRQIRKHLLVHTWIICFTAEFMAALCFLLGPRNFGRTNSNPTLQAKVPVQTDKNAQTGLHRHACQNGQTCACMLKLTKTIPYFVKGPHLLLCHVCSVCVPSQFDSQEMEDTAK